MTLGEKIRTYRQRLGLSQEGLAERLNVSRQAVTKWEADSGVPDIDNLIALSKVMGVTLDELVMGEKESDVEDVHNGVMNQRKKDSTLYLIAAVCFGIAIVCWIISLALNVNNGNTVAAVLSAVNVMLVSFPTGVYLRKYIETR